MLDTQAAAQLQQLETNCDEFGIRLFGLDDSRQGIVHVIGPEQGLTQPGMTIVCGDSHTSTHGAFGALAFGIGTSEVGYVLATQTLLQRKPRNMEVRIDGVLPPGVTAKDIILAVIAEVGIGGATGHVLEYTGSAIRSLGMEQRMTICNMSIEAGARAGLIAPDEKTAEYIKGRPFAPTGDDWYAALARWQSLVTDEGARYDRSVHLDAARPGADDHVRHQPIDGDSHRRTRARSGRRGQRRARGSRQGAPLHVARAGTIAARTSRRCRVRGELYQLAHLRSAAGGDGDARPARRARSANARRSRLEERQIAGGSRRDSIAFSRRRARSGGKPGARCASR